MVVSLAQHIGKPALPVVREGQEVQRGQVLAAADGFVSVPVHAPVTGRIIKIAPVPGTSGSMVPGVYLQTLPGSTQELAPGSPCDPDQATAAEILDAIQQAGIVGLGGAAFPSHVKLKIPSDKGVDTLLINGAECEPCLTTDHRVMLEQSADIFTGIRYLLKVTGAPRAVIGIEANKQDAAGALQQARPGDMPLSIEVVPVKYPQGAEKMLINTLLGREVPTGVHAVDVGVVGVNVATAAEIGRLLPRGLGIVERVITVTGPAVKNKGNYRVPVGTPLRFLLESVGVSDDVTRVVMGGPMMGPAIANLDTPVTKGTSGVVAFGATAGAPAPPVHPCIHCGYCVEACAMNLNPSQLGLLANQQRYQQMAGEFHLYDCFECGACSYVCPSHIPLVQQFRAAKAYLKKNEVA
jgi:electron transport complex protein RnfC